MNTTIRHLIAILLLAAAPAATLTAAPQATAAAPAFAEYKVLSGYKQPFNDALQYHLSKGWQPVGGVAVTTWNNDLYFAQLIGRPVKSGQ